MKNLKQIIARVNTLVAGGSSDELNDILWQLICYSPKMPLRLHQEQLLNEAETFSLQVKDEYFENKNLLFNGFKWGKGSKKVLITHGWGSKAADFIEIIIALKQLDDLQIFAFDAPGNGSSEGKLSNLILYVDAVKAIISNYGEPDIVIGHSLGGMANIIVLKEMQIVPSLLISLTPLVLLKENFETSMIAAGVPLPARNRFFESFEARFTKPVSFFDLNDWYEDNLNHWLAYDQNDKVSPYRYLKEFLTVHPSVRSRNYEGAGHDRILKSPDLINDLLSVVRDTIVS